MVKNDNNKMTTIQSQNVTKPGRGAHNSKDKHVGFAHVAASASSASSPLGEEEKRVRHQVAQKWWLTQFMQANFSNCLVFIIYLITAETLISCGLTIGLTYFWHRNHEDSSEWEGGRIDFVLLGFAVVNPITVTIGLAFRRREQALYEIRRIRSYCFQIYISNAVWDWPGKDEKSGRIEAGINWLEHTDQVLEQLIAIGDELTGFLTLPTSSYSFHRTLKSGRKEAAQIIEVAYRLFDSLYTQRMTQLSLLNETLKSLGLSTSEASRIRQYERYIGEALEGLRMIKMYRTPQALRAFGRIFTLIIPPIYAPRFAQLALDLESLPMAFLFAAITPFCLTALFNCTHALEDPFVGYVTLDGIDVSEEFEVLHWHQLMNARKILFPHAEDFEDKTGMSEDSGNPDQAQMLEKQTLGSSCRSSHLVNYDLGFSGRSGRLARRSISK